MPVSTRIFYRLQHGWHGLLGLGFGVLCLRYLYAACLSADWSLWMLCGLAFSLAWWRPSASPFALILGFSLLNGVQQTVLQAPYSALLVVASSMWLGFSLRKGLHSFISLPPSETTPRIPDRPTLLVELLASAALLFSFIHIWPHRTTPDFWPRFFYAAGSGPGDPLQFPDATFLWLHGLFYFRALREPSAVRWLTSNGIKLVLLINGAALLLFVAVQWWFDLPARWNPGFQSPFEDIATFGIMATCLLIHNLTELRRGVAPRRLLVHGAAALLLTVAVAASWSRGTWLACAVCVGVLALLRLPRCLTLIFAGLLLGGVVFLNMRAQQLELANQLYLDRLVSLVRWESLRTKNSDRLELYYKASAMIRERPLLGHGIGSFYREATRYSRPGDPYGDLHQLPHNVLLQLAAEQGLPVAVLFAGLVGAALWRGARCWLAPGRRRGGPADGETAGQLPLRFLALGLTLMLAAYLQANMTWDILTVHPTQSFFFWFVVAALWATADRIKATPTSA